MYDLGADGQGIGRVATMSQSTIVAAAGNIARYIWVCSTSNIFPSDLSIINNNKTLFSPPVSLKLSYFCRTIDRSVFKPIVQISVIDRSESSDCHLLAVTHAGKDEQTVVKMSRIVRYI